MTTGLLAVGATGITFGLPKLVAGIFPARLLGTMSTVYILGSYAGVAAVAGVGALAIAGSVLGAAAAVLVVGGGLGGVSPLLRAIPTGIENIGPELTATAVSLVFAVGEIGGFLGPFLVGSPRDLTGFFVPGLAALAVGAIAMVVAGTRLPEVRT